MIRPSFGARPSSRVRAGSPAYPQWHAVVWNDPITLASYVRLVFQHHFGYSPMYASWLMKKIRRYGSVCVAEGSREHMEADVVALHSYGLHATLESTR